MRELKYEIFPTTANGDDDDLSSRQVGYWMSQEYCTKN